MMFSTEIKADALVARLSVLEKKELPFALAVALNNTAFQDVREGWKDAMPRVFDRPTRLTLNAVLVKKASKKNPVAEVFLRNTASRGTPPARYLFHHIEGIEGNVRKHKAFENFLIAAGVMQSNEFAVPGRSFPLDAFGNINPRILKKVLADIQAGPDPEKFSTAAKRAKRARSRRRRGGVYFSADGKGYLPRGVYERIDGGLGSAVRTVLHFVSSVRYEERFDAYGLAQDLFDEAFPRRFEAAMKKAVATSNKKRK